MHAASCGLAANSPATLHELAGFRQLVAGALGTCAISNVIHI